MFIFEVAFTGSTEVGHIVQKAAGKRLKPYQTSSLHRIIF
jgi:acyl-CoA reductase-like NAD-dependent aldehyde dehydrogenase